MSTVKANTYQDASGGNTATINSMTPTADSLQGFRNRIINGDMRIDQRNAGASVANANGFITDRWTMAKYSTGGGAYSGQQVSDAPTGFVNSLKVTVTTNESSQPADAYWQVVQYIEGFNSADLGFGTSSPSTITLSFWVKSSVTGTYSVAFYNNGQGGVARSYIATYTINSANTWEQKSITITGDGSGGSGYWSTTTGYGPSVFFDMGSGTNTQTTANSWQTGNYRRTSGSVRLMATNGATWFVTGVQLEVGSVATPFERRPYGTELSLCQRYCTVYTGVVYGYYQFGTAYSTTRAITMVGLPVTMRTTPALSTTGNFRLHDAVTTTAVTAFAITNSSDNIFGIDSTVASGLTQYRPYFLGSNNDTTAKLIASAEL